MNNIEKNVIILLTNDINPNKLILFVTRNFQKSINFFMNMVDNALMTLEELAEYLRVKKRTVYDWVKKGKIPAIKAVGQWRFKKETIDAWLESHH